MKLSCHSSTLRFVVMAILSFGVVSGFAVNLPDEIKESDRFGAFTRSGDTNAPLLAMDWFSGPRIIEFCRVSQSGKVSSARNVINWAIQGGHWAQLDQTNLAFLTNAINSLPSPVSGNLPKERILAVRGFRTYQWCELVYDRQNIPKEVEKLYEITGAYLEWFIPKIEGKSFLQNSYDSRSGGQSEIESFHIATAAPIAVSSGGNGVHIWDLAHKTVQPLSILIKDPKANFNLALWNPTAISPDGKIIVYASEYATFAVDWKADKILWETGPLVDMESGDCLTKKLAIGGDKGQYLFVAGARKVERWDLATGKFLATLATNTPTSQFFETSRDGKTLIAGFNDAAIGGCITMSSSISVWKADEEIPAAHIETKQFTGIGVSSDGKKLALSIFGNQKLLLWNWQKGTTNEVPLRTPYGSFPHAYAMFWSPDRTRFTAYMDSPSAHIVVCYDALNWKPLAQWPYGSPGSSAKFDFTSDGQFIGMQGRQLSSLDVKSLAN